MANEKTFSLLKQTITEAVENLSASYQGSSLTDIFITVDKESGEVTVYDDEENSVAKIVIYEWINNTDLDDVKISSVLRTVIDNLDDNDVFKSLEMYYPFSVNYADENMTVIEELLRLDDDAIITIDDDLLSKFDKEFDDFIDKLMKG